MFCSKCGEDLEGSAKFCSKCGNPTRMQPSSPGGSGAAFASPPAASKRSKGLALLAGAAAVVLVLFLVFVVFKPVKPFDTVERFADAYNKLDYNQMIDCVDPRITDTINTLLGGISSFFGLPTASKDSTAVIISLVGDLLSGYSSDYWARQGGASKMTVKEVSTVMNGKDKAKVTIEFTVTSSNGAKQTWQETWSMVKIKGKWYITFDWLEFFGIS
ncbi:MAG: zinc ribbon domain-containing protein [Eggerthellaceae bacterium]|nr:zinc ribbon domain-containing protein [Eggerthellaceae bacterium]